MKFRNIAYRTKWSSVKKHYYRSWIHSINKAWFASRLFLNYKSIIGRRVLTIMSSHVSSTLFDIPGR